MNDAKTSRERMLGSVSRQGAIVLVTRGAAVLLGIASTVLLGRFLGPTGYGKFRLGSVVVTLIAGLCLIGLDRALMRYLPILEARGEQRSSRALLIKSGSIVLVLSLLLSAALLVWAPFVARVFFRSTDMVDVLRAFSFQLPVLALFRFFAGAVIAAKRVDISSKITNIVSPAVFVLLLGVSAYLHQGIYGAIGGRVLAQLAAVACLALYLMRRYPSTSDVASETAPTKDGTFNDYLRLSLPLFFIGLGYQLLNQMDTLMLGHFASEKEVGLYSVALKVSAFVVLGLDILLPIVSPLFSQFRETNDQDSMKSLFETVTKWLFYSALVIFACLIIFRVEVLGIFGKGFRAAATVLLILSVGQLTNAATGPTGALLTMTGKQKWEVGNTVSMLVFNFVLNLLLIPKLGMIGAAIATALTIATINGLKLVQVYMLFGLRAHNSKYIKGVAAITLGGVIAYTVRAWLQNLGLNPYLIISFGGLAFLITALGALWIMGLDEEDKVALLALRRRRASQSCQAVEC